MIWSFGSRYVSENEAEFKVWHPFDRDIELKLLTSKRTVPLEQEDNGILAATARVARNELYMYRVGNSLFPDPASHYQPDGVHGPSMVVDHSSYSWEIEGWKGRPMDEYILYELHVGTFGEKGTYMDVLPKIDHIRNLGITAVELMPISQFPGRRNWGYDGVQLYSPQNSYGETGDLKRLVDTFHGAGIDVVLDVVYNHVGPEGNYLPEFGPYFHPRYQTGWGDALNFDGPHSDPVRRYFIDNALYWLDEVGFDALRLDAVHAILDGSARPFLQELAEMIQASASAQGRHIHLIAESDLNDPVLVQSKERCGFGLAGQWNDDYHHAIHAFLTGERNGYYSDFGRFGQITRSLKNGFVYDGVYSEYRKKTRGAPLMAVPLNRLVVYSQNHDQVGNRAGADRLTSLVAVEKVKAAASLAVLSPFTPLIFMGEEYGENAPFNYFIDTGDRKLARAVREGRSREFMNFGMKYDLDPNNPEMFEQSKLKWERMDTKSGKAMFNFYRDLVSVRKTIGKRRMALHSVSSPAENLIRISYGKDEKLDVFISLSNGKISLEGIVPQGSKVLFRSGLRDYGGTLEPSGQTAVEIEPFESIVSSPP